MKTKNLPDFCQLLAASLKLLVPQVRGFTDMFQKPQDRGEFGKVQWLFCQDLEQGEPWGSGGWEQRGACIPGSVGQTRGGAGGLALS